MTTSEHTELRDMIARTWDEMGCRGTKDDVLAHLRVSLPGHLRDYLVEQGLGAKVGSFFRSRNEEGMPTAPEIDGHGTHAQLELLDVGEFRYVIAQQVSNSVAARKQARKYAELCHATHGVWIDLDNPFGQEAAS